MKKMTKKEEVPQITIKRDAKLTELGEKIWAIHEEQKVDCEPEKIFDGLHQDWNDVGVDTSTSKIVALFNRALELGKPIFELNYGDSANYMIGDLEELEKKLKIHLEKLENKQTKAKESEE